MSRSNFFRKKTEFLTIEQALKIADAKLADKDKNCELSTKIYDVATLENADKSQISFLNSGQYFQKFTVTNAGFCLIDEANANKVGNNSNAILLISKNPYFSYAKIVAAFYEENSPDFVENNLIHPTAKIGENCRISPLSYIGKNVVIGKNCFIGPNSSIMDGCILGDNVIVNSCAVVSFAVIGSNSIIYNGAKIGQDGFGFAHNAGVNHKISQIGIVKIGCDVEIGANSCVDRGAIENTVIGDGTKIDNLVQIGHNVVIGKGTVIAGGTSIAGSVKIGNFVQIGGNCSIVGHINVSDGAKVAGMSGIIRDVAPFEVVGGVPAIPIRSWHRLNAKLIAMSKAKTSKTE